ncbi:MAG: LuxR family transcriptional regulator [Candidatus Rokubacteria bacterium]|nr:LuxR family transcriptional regulator [Candidatus Rokubacteria bacterium]
MGRLNQRDLRVLLDRLREIYAIPRPGAFSTQVISANSDANRPKRRITWLKPALERLISDHPFNPSRRGLTERDRLYLNLLRPHLVQAYRNAEAVAQMQRELMLVRKGIEDLGRGVILLGRKGLVRLMTVRARQWLAEHFGSQSWQVERLPEALRQWVRHQETLLGRQGDGPPSREPLVVERQGKRLVVRLLAAGGQSLLLLEEQPTALQPASLERFRLTQREGEVLVWVAEGKTNEEVATILGLSPLTVKKHLERIYQKLGVETRTAAARALQATP